MDHSASLRRLYDLLNAGDIDGFGELLADDFVEHEETPNLAPTKEGVLEFFRMYRAGFPDLRFNVEDVCPAATRSSCGNGNRNPQGRVHGHPRDPKSVNVALIDIIRFADDGLAHEHWGIFDAMMMMQQLGLVPDGPPA